VEDDYDAEFRYDREPIGAMQGLDPDHVIYAGTASKTLAPGLRLGWLAVPHRLSERIARAKVAADYGSGAMDQLALADFIACGELDRHLRRMRLIYRGRRDALLAGLARHLPAFEPLGASAGLHVMARLPVGLDEMELVRAATTDGIGLSGAGETYVGAGVPGLVFGYGVISERGIADALGRVGTILRGP
jgi:GntR family transcriptional regulator/MocR family aminotransferase